MQTETLPYDGLQVFVWCASVWCETTRRHTMQQFHPGNVYITCDACQYDREIRPDTAGRFVKLYSKRV